MFYDDSQYCKRCHKLYYLTHERGSSYDFCPKCQEYFKKHRDKYLLFTGEYIKCKNCGKVDHYMCFNSENICERCEERFKKYPILRWFYKCKLGFLWLGNGALSILLLIVIIAVVLAIAYYIICALIGEFNSLDQPIDGFRMKP